MFSSFVSFSTDRNKIHTVPSTSVDDRRCGNETDSVSWVMAVFIEGAVLVMASGFIAILIISVCYFYVDARGEGSER